MEYIIYLYLSIIISSFFLLIKSADYLVISSSILGKRAGISSFVIGLTLVAIGTSLPELFTSIFGILDSSNSAAFVFGTVAGSNIANVLLVFTVLLFFANKFKTNVKFFDMFYFSLATISLLFILLLGNLTYIYSLTFLFLFCLYLYLSVKLNKKEKFESEIEEDEINIYSKKSLTNLLLIFLSSLIGLNIAAKGVVYGIENFGILLSIPIEFLTFTTVAFATSLPEIVVTYSSSKTQEFDLAVGNIIGSNISNIFLILGVVGLIKTINFESSVYYISIITLILSSILFLYLINKKNIGKKTSFFLFSIYLVYVYFLL